MEAYKKWYKLSDLAGNRWPTKTEDDILELLGSCVLLALYWHEGPVFMAKAPFVNELEYYDCPDLYYRGFVWVYGEEIGLLRLKEETRISRLMPYENLEEFNKLSPDDELEPLGSFYPAKEVEKNGKSLWIKTTHPITRNDLMIPTPEVMRAEEQNPDFCSSKTQKKNEDLSIMDATSKEKKTDTHIIGAMLNTILERKEFKNKTKLIEYLAKDYGEYFGISIKTLGNRFRDAEKAISMEDQ